MSKIAGFDGTSGKLEYRGYELNTLVENSRFLEVGYLLLFGDLPTETELVSWEKEIFAVSTLNLDYAEFLSRLPKTAHPMHTLAAAVANLPLFDRCESGQGLQENLKAFAHLVGVFPHLVAGIERHRRGLPLPSAKPSLGYVGNFFWLWHGRTPSPGELKALESALIIHADHGLSPSTLVERICCSTGSDPYSGIVAAIAALKGPLHGGANEAVLRQYDEIGKPNNVEAWLENRIATRSKIMGMGHTTYKTKDPRAVALQKVLTQFFSDTQTPASDYFQIASTLENVAKRRLADRKLFPNVDFYSGVLYHQLGFPTDTFTTLFALGRICGWLAHWQEQADQKRLIDGGSEYTGHRNREFIALPDRKG